MPAPPLVDIAILPPWSCGNLVDVGPIELAAEHLVDAMTETLITGKEALIG
ncbi:hypothetical protein BQ8482_330146 [Mesorhizobium delmotii]|uniref:Uncharacterized protein n=1 Tax=Mesorhizobium delmotii TaxID=1631247 RepID=A0A2P9APB7_9HYPH|nr:hypothetical protein BQ8482_330146 [Mesorhizobium delmotii]